VDRPDLAEDARFRTSPDRVQHRAECVGLVQEIVRTHTRDHWIALLTQLGVPCAPINTLEEVLAHEHTVARGIVLDYDHPRLGPLKTIAQPIQFGTLPRGIKSPPPMLGEHSRAVLREIGYADDEIAALAKSGLIVDGAT
jgi:crotonobetainyl-CoA:carnitine CoA-transferase CaiB-like acyl-CoA transferase